VVLQECSAAGPCGMYRHTSVQTCAALESFHYNHETTWCTPIGVMTETVSLATLVVQVLWRPASTPYAGCQP
jgi:hypothetical protein